jgi:acetoacetyl-CoA synthetase
MYSFMQAMNGKYGLQLETYHDLFDWSVEHLEEFWGECWSFCGIRSRRGFDEVCCGFF